jgi:hypothetical protein
MKQVDTCFIDGKIWVVIMFGYAVIAVECHAGAGVAHFSLQFQLRHKQNQQQPAERRKNAEVLEETSGFLTPLKPLKF